MDILVQFMDQEMTQMYKVLAYLRYSVGIMHMETTLKDLLQEVQYYFGNRNKVSENDLNQVQKDLEKKGKASFAPSGEGELAVIRVITSEEKLKDLIKEVDKNILGLEENLLILEDRTKYNEGLLKKQKNLLNYLQNHL